MTCDACGSAHSNRDEMLCPPCIGKMAKRRAADLELKLSLTEATMAREIDKAVAAELALRRYGRHDDSCDKQFAGSGPFSAYPDCSCGFTKALTSARGGK